MIVKNWIFEFFFFLKNVNYKNDLKQKVIKLFCLMLFLKKKIKNSFFQTFTRICPNKNNDLPLDLLSVFRCLNLIKRIQLQTCKKRPVY